MTIAEGHVGLAFGLTFASGAATMLGASVVFFPKLVKLASRRVLAGSLGFSAGVMVYISFVDILKQSFDAFMNSGYDESRAYTFATLCFFIGIIVMKIVEIIVYRLSGDHHPNRREIDEDIVITWNENEEECEMHDPKVEEFIVPHCVGCSADPVGDLKKWHAIADAEINMMEQESDLHRNTSSGTAATIRGSAVINDEESGGRDVLPTLDESAEISADLPPSQANSSTLVVTKVEKPFEFQAPKNSQLSPTEEKKRLFRIGLTTAAAIAIHNFPEGLASFVAALKDPFSGALLAIGIGAHNIPEGVCVALPIYYATGSRWKGFLWGTISGMAEPIAALVGFAVLANVVTEEVYAVLFGLVSGMMIMISMKELLPTAHRYDPEDTVVTSCTIGGMAVMALSLVLLNVST